jgi:AraC-like DNA-binding protein
MSLQTTLLYQTSWLSLRQVACRPDHKGPGAIEDQPGDSLILPLRGAFLKHLSPREQVLAEPGQALFFAAGRPYRISHPVAGDDCLAVDLDASTWSEILTAAAGVDDLRSPALAAHGLLPPPAMAARQLLWRRIGCGVAEPLEIEETSLALLAAAVRAARREVKPARRPDGRSRRRQQVEAAKLLLLTRPEERWTLRDLARQVYASPYHLAHVFREESGLPVHQYHLRARLARAVDELLDSERDLAAIALDLGFAHHSHFTAAFRRQVGLAPREFRRRASVREASQVRKILTAPAAGKL